MNEQLQKLYEQSFVIDSYVNVGPDGATLGIKFDPEKFAELIAKECINREELLGAIARGWCSEKNEHKTMDSDLALAIFDEVEQQIKQKFGVE